MEKEAFHMTGMTGDEVIHQVIGWYFKTSGKQVRIVPATGDTTRVGLVTLAVSKSNTIQCRFVCRVRSGLQNV